MCSAMPNLRPSGLSNRFWMIRIKSQVFRILRLRMKYVDQSIAHCQYPRRKNLELMAHGTIPMLEREEVRRPTPGLIQNWLVIG